MPELTPPKNKTETKAAPIIQPVNPTSPPMVRIGIFSRQCWIQTPSDEHNRQMQRRIAFGGSGS